MVSRPSSCDGNMSEARRPWTSRTARSTARAGRLCGSIATSSCVSNPGGNADSAPSDCSINAVPNPQREESACPAFHFATKESVRSDRASAEPEPYGEHNGLFSAIERMLQHFYDKNGQDEGPKITVLSSNDDGDPIGSPSSLFAGCVNGASPVSTLLRLHRQARIVGPFGERAVVNGDVVDSDQVQGEGRTTGRDAATAVGDDTLPIERTHVLELRPNLVERQIG